MSDEGFPTSEAIDKLFKRLDREAKSGGYNLNPDSDFTLGLVEGLLVNQARYGYQACPCRLADGVRKLDLDIICPCDYRDPDLVDYGMCYCALYVSDAVLEGKQTINSIPERRPDREGQAAPHEEELVGFTRSGIPVWRCNVCGYLCAREKPPLKCPICKADQDRFTRFA
jgi:ferredoxin-thioredoxin reductase catalytic chain